MTTIVYKLTNADGTTLGGMTWPLGVWRETSGTGELCGPGWLHCYTDPLLAVMLNPMHANFECPRMLKCEAEGAMRDDKGLKRGYTRLRAVEEMPVPAVTAAQRIRFGILCALAVPHTVAFAAWAEKWLSGEDRSRAAAAEGARAAEAVWAAAAAAAAEALEEAALEEAEAVWAAAARKAAAALAAAAARAVPIDLAALARRAVEEEPAR